LRFALCAIAK